MTESANGVSSSPLATETNTDKMCVFLQALVLELCLEFWSILGIVLLLGIIHFRVHTAEKYSHQERLQEMISALCENMLQPRGNTQYFLVAAKCTIKMKAKWVNYGIKNQLKQNSKIISTLSNTVGGHHMRVSAG